VRRSAGSLPDINAILRQSVFVIKHMQTAPAPPATLSCFAHEVDCTCVCVCVCVSGGIQGFGDM